MVLREDKKMARYKKKPVPLRPTPITEVQPTMLLGMLYVVEVRMVNAVTGEKIKHKLLLVGCEQPDIERKLKWIFDARQYSEFSISGIEKVREKVHFLSTFVTQEKAPTSAVIERDERSQVVAGQPMITEPYDPKLYAVGITTMMLAKDEVHAMRKVGHALLSHATEGKSHSGAHLSEDSTIAIEEVPRSSGYAKARDVFSESNRAHFVRG
jgi:hypothetical protein